jgi:hypothetical protein
MGKAAALPYQMLVGRRCRAAQTSVARLFPVGIEIEWRRKSDETPTLWLFKQDRLKPFCWQNSG